MWKKGWGLPWSPKNLRFFDTFLRAFFVTASSEMEIQDAENMTCIYMFVEL